MYSSSALILEYFHSGGEGGREGEIWGIHQNLFKRSSTIRAVSLGLEESPVKLPPPPPHTPPSSVCEQYRFQPAHFKRNSRQGDILNARWERPYISPKRRTWLLLPTLTPNPIEKLGLCTIWFPPLTLVYWKHHTRWTTLCPQGKADNLAGMQRVFVGFSAQSQRLQNQDIQLSKTGQENRYIIMLL